MSQPASPGSPESFAARPDPAPAGDILSTMLRTVLGQPPMAYLTKLRMELARDLLLGTSETAKQVARRTGYKFDAAFNRAFTRGHGCSPGQWRHDHITR